MTPLLHGISIGNVELPSNLLLAPLAGYTDKVYRSICLSHGAALAYTEMVSCEGVARGNDNRKISGSRHLILNFELRIVSLFPSMHPFRGGSCR